MPDTCRDLSNLSHDTISPGDASIERLATWIHETVQRDSPEGWTIDPRELVVPEFGPDEYLVSIRGHERCFQGVPATDDLADWLESCWELLGQPPTLAGCWHNARQGVHVLDVTLSVVGFEPALAFARGQAQRAIYHPNTAMAIPIFTPRRRNLTPQKSQTVWRIDRDPSREVRA